MSLSETFNKLFLSILKKPLTLIVKGFLLHSKKISVNNAIASIPPLNPFE